MKRIAPLTTTRCTTALFGLAALVAAVGMPVSLALSVNDSFGQYIAAANAEPTQEALQQAANELVAQAARAVLSQ